MLTLYVAVGQENKHRKRKRLSEEADGADVREADARVDARWRCELCGVKTVVYCTVHRGMEHPHGGHLNGAVCSLQSGNPCAMQHMAQWRNVAL